MIELKTDNIVALKTEKNGDKKYLLRKYLGGGATSSVWLVHEVDDEGNSVLQTNHQAKPFYDMALKVLHLGQEERWRKEFEDELQIMKSLWEAEEALGDGKHVIPELYDFSPIGAPSSFLLMEYVPYPSVESLVQPYLNLQHDVDELYAQEQDVAERLRRLVATLRNAGVWDEDSAGVAEKNLGENGEPLLPRTLRSKLQAALDELAQRKQLSDQDIIEIGLGVCRALQLLHHKYRAYKDFQLTNVRWDEKNKQVKIIDWNVVTEANSVDLARGWGRDLVQRDIFRLASALFWLRTLANVPAAGLSPQELAQLGGAAWHDGTKLPLRLVLEKALSIDPQQRYQEAFTFSEPETTRSITEMHSLGAALQRIQEWYQLRFGQLMAQAEQYQNQRLWSDAWAVLDLAQSAIVAVPAQAKQGVAQRLAEKIEHIRKEISGERPNYEIGLRLLRSGDLGGAQRHLSQAVSEQPNDTMARRWLVIANMIAEQSLKLERQGLLWKNDHLAKCLVALEEERWASAEQLLADLQKDLPEIDWGVLGAELEMGRRMTALRRQWHTVEALWHEGMLDDPRIHSFLASVKQIKETDLHAAHPYLHGLLPRKWPEWQQWQKLTVGLEQEQNTFQEYIRKLKETPDGEATGAYCEYLHAALNLYPGNARLSALGNQTCRQLLEAGRFQDAADVATTLLKSGGGTQLLQETQLLRDVAHAWLRLQLARQKADWNTAFAALEQLQTTLPALGPALLRYLTRKTSEAPLSDEDAWTQAQARLGTEERASWEHRLHGLKLFTDADKVSELDAALGQLDVWLKALAAKPDLQALHTIALDVRNQLQQRLETLQLQKIKAQAEREESVGDVWRDQFEFQKAKEAYENAIPLYQQIDDQLSVRRLQRTIENLNIVNAHKSGIEERLAQSQQMRKDLDEGLEKLSILGYPTNPPPPLLGELARICGALQPYEYLPRVKREIEAAKEVAARYGSLDVFWKEAMRPQLKQALSILEQPLQPLDHARVQAFEEALDLACREAPRELPPQQENIAILQEQLRLAVAQLWQNRFDNETVWPQAWWIGRLQALLSRLQTSCDLPQESLLKTEGEAHFQSAKDALQWLQAHAGVPIEDSIPRWVELLLPPRSALQMPFPPFEPKDSWLDECEVWLRFWRGDFSNIMGISQMPIPLQAVQEWLDETIAQLLQLQARENPDSSKLNAAVMRVTRINYVLGELEKITQEQKELSQIPGDATESERGYRSLLHRLSSRLNRRPFLPSNEESPRRPHE